MCEEGLPTYEVVYLIQTPDVEVFDRVAESVRDWGFETTLSFICVTRDGLRQSVRRFNTNAIKNPFSAQPTHEVTYEFRSQLINKEGLKLWSDCDVQSVEILEGAKIFGCMMREDVLKVFPTFCWKHVNGSTVNWHTVFVDLQHLGFVHFADAPPMPFEDDGFYNMLILHIEGFGTKWKKVPRGGKRPMKVKEVIFGEEKELVLPIVAKLWKQHVELTSCPNSTVVGCGNKEEGANAQSHRRERVKPTYSPNSLYVFGFTRNIFSGFTCAVGPIVVRDV